MILQQAVRGNRRQLVDIRRNRWYDGTTIRSGEDPIEV